MKTVLKLFLAVVLLLVLGLGSVMYTAFGHNSPIVDGEALPGGGRVIKDGFVQVDILPAGDRQVALIDCGNDREGKAILAELSREGLGPDAVKAIFLTHGHNDHTAGCHLFPNATVYGFAADQGLAAQTETPPGFMGTVMGLFFDPKKGLTINGLLQDNQVVAVGPLSVRAYLIPGHTKGSAAYFVNGGLYLGDSAGVNKSGELMPAVKTFSQDAAENRTSLRQLSERLVKENARVERIICSHTGTVASLAPLEKLSAQP